MNDVRMSGFRPLGDHVDSTFKLAAKPGRPELVAFAVHRSAASTSSTASGWASTATGPSEGRKSPANFAPRDRLDRSAIELRHAPGHLGCPGCLGVFVHLSLEALEP
jgi:hypothetical protein